nr:copia protein [Tanacetum cinerariifolium]
MIRNKARLVAQGYTQVEWINYDEVFVPVVNIEVIRLFLAYASFKDFVEYQMDVKSAFLCGKIEEEVYFWSTAMAKTINREVQLHAQVDSKEIVITESSSRRDLQVADEEGIDCLPNSTIFEQLVLMGVGKGFSSRVTPLFQIMVQQLGEGSTIPTDPQHTPTIIQPSSSQAQKTQKPRKPTRKDTQVPQPSGPTKSIVDKAVHKELGVSLVRATTTASSLIVEHDNGKITKTQSKATPNESSSEGTNQVVVLGAKKPSG